MSPTYFHGKIDELRFYNRALTQDEILQLQDVIPNATNQDTTLCFGETVLLDAGPASSYNWIPTAGLSCNNCQTPVAAPGASTTYQVVLNAAQGCPDTLSIQVDIEVCDSCEFTLTGLLTTSPACTGTATGSIQVTALGNGTPPYQFSLNGGSWGGNHLFPNLPAGTYLVSVRDSLGCIADTTISLAPPVPLTLGMAALTDAACHGSNSGSASLYAAGGTLPYTFTLNGGVPAASGVFSTLSAGVYTAAVQDALGCVATLTFVVSEPSPLVAVIEDMIETDCFGSANGSLLVNALGGTPPYAFALNGGLPSPNGYFPGLTVATYQLLVIDAFSCSTIVQTNVTGPMGLFTAPVSLVAPRCTGDSSGSVSLQTTGGVAPYQYALNGGSFQTSPHFNGLAAGTYSLTTQDANACNITTSITLVDPPPLQVLIHNQTGVNCTSDTSATVTLAATGGTAPYEYSRDGLSYSSLPYLTGLPAGAHLLWVRDDAGCEAHTWATITHLPPVTGSVHVLSDFGGFALRCASDSTGVVTVDGQGGTPPYSYQWGHGASGDTAYSVPSTPPSWVIVRDTFGCADTLYFELSAPPPLAAVAEVSSDYSGYGVSCHDARDGSLRLMATGGVSPYQVQWEHGQAGDSIYGLSPGRYDATLIDANGCISRDSIFLNAPPPISLDWTATPVRCWGEENGSLEIAASGGVAPYAFEWISTPPISDPRLSGLAVGTYGVWVTDFHGCQIMGTGAITQPDKFSLVVDTLIPPHCDIPNGQLGLRPQGGNGPPHAYQWQQLPGVDGPFATQLAPGSYMVDATDSLGCVANISVELIAEPVPISAFEAQSIAISADINEPLTRSQAHILLQNQSLNGFSYLWDMGDGSPLYAGWQPPRHTYEASGTYTLRLITYDRYFGCPDTAFFTLVVIPDGKVYIPTAFSPNGDGTNEFFVVRGEGVEKIEIDIFNRWGHLVRRLHALEEPWDGRSQSGVPLPEGVFVVVVRATLNGGIPFYQSATLTLIR